MNLLRYLHEQSWKLLWLSTACALVSGLAGASLVALISKGIGNNGGLDTLAWLFFGNCLVYMLAKTASELSLLHLTQRAILQLRINLSNKVLATPARRLQELGKPGLLVVLTKDIDVFVQSFVLVPLALGNLILIVVCLAYLAWLSWSLFAILAGCLIVGAWAFHLAEQHPLRMMRQVREHVDLLFHNFRSLVDGSRELQLNAERGEAFVHRVIAPGAQLYKQAFVQGTTAYTWVLNVGAILFYLVIGVVLFIVPRWIPQPVQTLTTVTLVLLYLIRPIGELMGALPSLRQSAIALNKMQQLDNVLHQAAPALVGAQPFDRAGPVVLELNQVTHRYPGDVDDTHFTLGPVNLRLHAGEIVFIVGGNGSGKTTLAMVLLGLYEPEGGAVHLNGTVVTSANIAHYRQFFSAVLADFHLFDHLLNNEAGAGEKTERYVSALGLGHKVKVVDGKFSTVNLSTGQRKRLALVLAYLEDRPIYLFDEWAADQDPVFKRVFYTELLPDLKARGKTVVVISHDDGYFQCADRLLKLEHGQLTDLQRAAA